MNTATSRRAGARLVAFLTSPAAKVTEQSLYRRAIYSRNLRFASSTTRRWQQSTPPSTTSPSPSHPSQTPLPTQATQKPSPSASQPTQNATAEKVQHELSPSDESEPLRALDEPPPAFDADSNQVDWTRSFQGLSSTPFTSEQAAILQQEIAFDDIEIKPDGIIYLPEIKYRRILNRAFGPGGWGLAPRGETIVTDRLVTREYGLVAGGRLISIARGEQQYFDASGIPTATEGCKSNALMRCCKDLGIASELWDPRFIKRFMKEMGREMVVEHQTTKKRRKHFMRKDDEVKYPFKEVAVGGASTGTGGGVRR